MHNLLSFSLSFLLAIPAVASPCHVVNREVVCAAPDADKACPSYDMRDYFALDWALFESSRPSVDRTYYNDGDTIHGPSLYRWDHMFDIRAIRFYARTYPWYPFGSSGIRMYVGTQPVDFTFQEIGYSPTPGDDDFVSVKFLLGECRGSGAERAVRFEALGNTYVERTKLDIFNGDNQIGMRDFLTQ